MTDAPVRTALVLRALGLGDLCTAVPALRAVRAAYPGHRLVLAAPGWQRPLAEALGVDEVIPTDCVDAPPEGLPAELRGVEVAVNLHGKGPNSSRSLAELDPGRLITFRHAAVAPTRDGPSWRREEHEVHRWCRLLGAAGIPADPTDLLLPAPTMAPLAPPGSVVVHPGAAAAARRWPVERFAAVTRALLGQGFHVAITGTGAELELCRRLVALVGPVASRERLEVLAGRTDLSELVATVAHASLVICNDTGIGHLASACATPSVLLFGPTPPSRWGPPPHGPHLALWKGSEGDPHAVDVDAGLLAIGVDDVLVAVDEVLAATHEHRGARGDGVPV